MTEITELHPDDTSTLIADPAANEVHCISCNTPLIGKFCHHCGEKIVGSKDFRISTIIEQGIDIFTHVDSKIFRSLNGLLFRPGLLPTEYIRGVRKPYMKPLQVFLLSNFFFFFFLSTADIFLVPSTWFFTDTYPGISQLAQQIATEKNITVAQLALLYDSKVGTFSKLFVISIVPVLAVSTWIIGYKKHPEYGKHVIHSIYILAFVMVYAVAISQVENLLPGRMPNIILKTVFGTVLIVYVYASLSRFLKQGIALRIVNTLLLTGLFIFSLATYRFVISWLTLRFFT